MRVYNRALSAAEVTALYSEAETQPTSTSLTWTTVTSETSAFPTWGYITEGSERVSLALPAATSFAVGESLAVIAAGAGGVDLAANPGESFVFPTGLIPAGSVTLGSWVDDGTGTVSTQNLDWSAIASDSLGQNLVAAVYGGDIWTSTTGGNSWTAQAGAGSRNWAGVASDSSGTNLVAVVSSGDIWTSGNAGGSWTDRSLAAPSTAGLQWFAVASDATGQNLVAVDYVNGTGGDIWTSTDSGSNWNNRSGSGYPSGRQWTTVASDATGTNLIAAAQGQGVWLSNNSGGWWTEASLQGNLNWFAVASDSTGTHLVATSAANDGHVWTSSNGGTTWTDQGVPGGASATCWYQIASSFDGRNLAIVDDGSECTGSGGDLWFSTDYGASWVAQGGAGSRAWHGVATDYSGSSFFGIAYGGDIWTYTSSRSHLYGNQNASLTLMSLGSGSFYVENVQGTWVSE